ncbi:MAG: PmoA family protein [Candidatus Flexifilum sp.]
MNVEYALDSDRLRAAAADRALFTYIFRPEMPRCHAPRPYFHPIQSLSGVPLTDAHPADHPWHYGLSLAIPQVDGVNFWGGGTYVAGASYVDRADHGRVVHLGWDTEWVERLRWLDTADEPLLEERRQLDAALLDAHTWQLKLTFSLSNITDHSLMFASPAVAGRAGAGYGGLFWRGTAAMRAWLIQAGDHTGEAAVHGSPAPSLDWRDPERGTGITFLDQPGNPRYPARWFVRQQDYPGVCIPLAFTEPLHLAAGEMLTLMYTILIADERSGEDGS